MPARKNPDQQAVLAAIRDARGKDSFAKEWAEHREEEIEIEENAFKKKKRAINESRVK